MLLAALSLATNVVLAALWLKKSSRARKLAAEVAAARAESEKITRNLQETQAALAAFADAPLGAFLWESADRRRGRANRALCALLGIPAAPDAGGWTSCELPFALPGADQDDELGRTGARSPFEDEYTRADGGKLVLLAAARSLPGEDAQGGGRGLCFAVDLTRHAQALRELKLGQESYRVFAETTPVGIWQIRLDGTTIYVNPAMTAMLELDSADDLMASSVPFSEFYGPEALEVVKREIAKRHRGKPSTYETEVIGRWGKRTRLLVYGAPVLNEYGETESTIGTFMDITERLREEEALRQSEERLRVAAECGNDIVYEWDVISGRMDWYGPLEERLGFGPGEIPRTRDAWLALIHHDDTDRVHSAVERHLGARKPFMETYRVFSKDGSYRHWSDRGTALRDESGKPYKWIGTGTDVTESKRAEESLRIKEEQLRQSQKLEAVGRLAGGIAHDFNNLLAAIMGYCELMMIRLEPDHPCRREVGEILGGSERAAGLIRQLLAFSRQEIPQPKVISPNFVLTSMKRMLGHMLEETIELNVQADPHAGRVRIDPVQMEQVIMNLVLNARDAMPRGGALVISTGDITLNGDVPGAYGRVKPGPYVRISVSDSGFGIGKDNLPHIFDPFFTTKDKGKGSGLGLSTVYGIVTQNKGCVLVETEVNKGSIFSLFLPRTEDDPEGEMEVRKALRSSSFVPKTVLLVEDDDEVRPIVRELLAQQGFLVLEAKKGSEALDIADKYDQPLHLLLTDMVLPGMDGRELADNLRAINPGIKILFMSGYTQDDAFREELAGGTRAFLQKPFTMSTLVGKIREVLM
jgi:two-component system cell cycle sensor histidine kinase/response regulator CckA